MAEEIRNIKEILREMFSGNSSAIEKYSSVRHAKDEIDHYLHDGMPKKEISREARRCVASKSFLGKSIFKATEEEISEAYKTLCKAEEFGCKPRCLRLVKELNHALIDLDLEPVLNQQAFLDWLTYSYHTVDAGGQPATEYGFEVRIFHDKENRKKFWLVLQFLLRIKKMMSMRNVVRLINAIDKNSSDLEGSK